MATIKDIAKEAGVSHGTASNVLNGKGNVSVKKIQLVEAAAKKLGYKMHYKAKSLRSGATNSVSIIVPTMESDEYVQLYKGLDKSLTNLGYRTHLYITYDLPNNEKSIIKEIAEERVTGIVTISCLDNANEYYNEMDIPKEHIIFVNRQLQHAEQFVSFDFKQAGAEISAFITESRYASIGIFSDELKFSNEKQFVEAIIQHTKGVSVKNVLHVPLNQSHSKAFEFFAGGPPEMIITSSLNKAYWLKNAHYFGSMQKPPKILSLGVTQPSYTDEFIVYQQNYHLLGREIAERLIEQVHHPKEADTIWIGNSGISHWAVKEQENPQKPLTILTIISPTTDALLKLLPHFTKTTGIEVTLDIKSFEEIYQVLTDQDNVNHYDMIRMDMAWLPWFGKDVLKPLANVDPQLDQLFQSLPPHMRENYSQIEGMSYAVPFDPSIQMLFYRKDLFEDPKIKRMYYEKYKKQLTLPQDFASYLDLTRFFTKSQFKHSPTEFGTSVTLGKSEIIALEFLARYYADNGKLIHGEQIQLEKEIAVKALDNYLQTVSVAQKLDASWWGESVNSFARGETAMVIGFMNHVSKIANNDFGSFIGSASVPGDKPILGGGVIGITKHTSQIHEAVSFIHWINKLEIAEQITLLGGTSANPNVCNNQTISMLYPWLYEANKANVEGKRDTKFFEGGGFNAKEVERVIGLSIEHALNNLLNEEQTIEQINMNLASFSNH
ncbi:LacI family transcriptional regulator [Paenibacillus elgii]|uniref:LacI family transcriptional regulator n=1 Tax=Paenibacillus elgii TaxID=189691 RepID=A0A2T6G982_9BACL|nr:extracellular solute-binding protein [Paenibacillus elgii]PUA40706.1 LacI family transcriptional regulator [Paenibacillus elgii]